MDIKEIPVLISCPKCSRKKFIMMCEKRTDFFGNLKLNYYCGQCGLEGDENYIKEYEKTHPKEDKVETNKMVDLPDNFDMPFCPRCINKTCFMQKKLINGVECFVCPQCRLKIEDDLGMYGDSILVDLWKRKHPQFLRDK